MKPDHLITEKLLAYVRNDLPVNEAMEQRSVSADRLRFNFGAKVIAISSPVNL